MCSWEYFELRLSGGKQKKNVKINIDELSLNDLELLRIRTKIGESFDTDVKDICSNHRYNLI